jgi:hypothetical protein
MNLASDDGMMLTRKTEQLGEKPVPAPLCPPQIPHGLAQARTRASAVANMKLTAILVMVLCSFVKADRRFRDAYCSIIRAMNHISFIGL